MNRQTSSPQDRTASSQGHTSSSQDRTTSLQGNTSSSQDRTASLQRHMEMLCETIGARPTGSAKNKEAVDYVLGVFQKCGFEVRKQELDCMDWRDSGASLSIDGQDMPAVPSEYSLPCDVEAGIVCLDTVDALQKADLSGKIAVLHGELCKEPLMPKNFEFYNPDEHKQIIALLEKKAPEAIITVSPNIEHIIQDGDFDIPCAVVQESRYDNHNSGLSTGLATGLSTGLATGLSTGLTTGLATEPTTGLTTGLSTGLATGLATGLTTGLTTGLATEPTTGLTAELSTELTTGLATGLTAKLTIRTERIPAKAHNVIATYGTGQSTICFAAHIDTKPATPGALDNASGVSALLALAESITGKEYPFKIEIALLNGEDYYSTPGEIAYMGGLTPEYNMAVNVDGIGLKDSATSVSFYECPEGLENRIMERARLIGGIERIEPWPMGDHMIFAMIGIPTIAMTASNIFGLLGTVTHSPDDDMKNIDISVLNNAVSFLLDCLRGQEFEGA